MYSKNYTVRWADLDANVHMRHSAYYDYAAQTRLLFMAEKGFGMAWFKEHNVSPIILREETVFLKEIAGNETINIDVRLLRMSKDGARWSFMNRFFKESGVLSAQLVVDGAWMNLQTRKLTAPPAELLQLFDLVEKCEGFSWIEK
jgi:acyl-CoA thioester hydrolase